MGWLDFVILKWSPPAPSVFGESVRIARWKLHRVEPFLPASVSSRDWTERQNSWIRYPEQSAVCWQWVSASELQNYFAESSSLSYLLQLQRLPPIRWRIQFKPFSTMHCTYADRCPAYRKEVPFGTNFIRYVHARSGMRWCSTTLMCS